MDCIALASFAHTHTREASGNVHRYWAENCHFEKVSLEGLRVGGFLIRKVLFLQLVNFFPVILS